MILRKGMWVTVNGRVGVLVWFTSTCVEVHLTDAAGATVEMTVVPLSAVAQAAYDGIPEARRPSEEVARQLGYLS